MTQTIDRIATLDESPKYVAEGTMLRELEAKESRKKLNIAELETRLIEDQTPISR